MKPNKGTKTMTKNKTYTIQINESQRELISRALNHLYEVDIPYHHDLNINGTDDVDITEDELSEKGRTLRYLYKMFHCDSLEQDGGLFSGDTLNGLCL